MTVIVWPAATTVHYPVTRRRQKHVPRDHCSSLSCPTCDYAGPCERHQFHRRSRSAVIGCDRLTLRLERCSWQPRSLKAPAKFVLFSLSRKNLTRVKRRFLQLCNTALVRCVSRKCLLSASHADCAAHGASRSPSAKADKLISGVHFSSLLLVYGSNAFYRLQFYVCVLCVYLCFYSIWLPLLRNKLHIISCFRPALLFQFFTSVNILCFLMVVFVFLGLINYILFAYSHKSWQRLTI